MVHSQTVGGGIIIENSAMGTNSQTGARERWTEKISDWEDIAGSPDQ